MRIVNETYVIKDVQKDVIANNSSVTICGICDGLRLENNSILICNGIVRGLYIDETSSATIAGTAEDVVNFGSLTISGIVNNLDNRSSLKIEPNAYINGEHY